MTKKRTLGALVALAFLITACSAGPGTGGTLEGTQWVLESYDQDGSLTILPETQYADVEFDASRVSGFSGCNEFNGLYRAGGRTLLISQLSGTRMACDEASMAFEQQYLSLLGSSRFYSVRRDQLTIFDAERNTVLVFNAAPRNPLLGKWRVDSYGTTPGTLVGVLEGTQLDVAFQLLSVGGSAGCNAYSGTYGTNGNVVRVGKLATTRLACDTAVMDQETAFLEALQGVAFIESRGSTLNLTDLSGQILVALARPTPDVEPDASASPEPSASATPAETPTPEVTAAPTATPEPTAKPTPKPTPPPTAPPSVAPSVAPSGAPPIELPPTASCALVPPGAPAVATIVYPGDWATVTAPPELACRYFDPEPITIPPDGSPVQAAVHVDLAAASYQDAIAAATDPASWNVIAQSEVDVGGTAVTCIGAVAVIDTAGIPAGDASYACLADVQAAGTVVLRTTGTPGDEVFESKAAIVSLMTMASTFTPPG